MNALKAKPQDTPVSFAAHALYALEKHGRRDEDAYNTVLFPVLRAKAHLLHSDGLSNALWALGQIEDVDEALVSQLVSEAQKKHFGEAIEYLRGKPMKTDEFLSGKMTHLSELTFSADANELFFGNTIQAVELNDGLSSLLEKSISGDLRSQIESLQASVRDQNSNLEAHSSLAHILDGQSQEQID